jgi:hypothetical protein
MNKQEIAKRIEQVESELALLRAEMDKQEIGVGDWISRACGDVDEYFKVKRTDELVIETSTTNGTPYTFGASHDGISVVRKAGEHREGDYWGVSDYTGSLFKTVPYPTQIASTSFFSIPKEVIERLVAVERGES